MTIWDGLYCAVAFVAIVTLVASPMIAIVIYEMTREES